MSLIRWEPRRAELHPLRSLQQEMDRFFNGWLSDRAWPSRGDWLAPFSGDMVPSVDLRETEGAYVLAAEVPGVKKEDLDVTFQGSVVTLSGERREEKERDERGYHRRESAFGSFKRSVELPGEVQADAVTAELKDGVLTLTFPKAEDRKANNRKIEVK